MMTSLRKYSLIKIVEKRGMAACASVEFGTEMGSRVHSTVVDRGQMMAGGGWGLAYERGFSGG